MTILNIYKLIKSRYIEISWCRTLVAWHSSLYSNILDYILEYLKILTSTSIFGIVLDSYNSELELENTELYHVLIYSE